MRLSGLTPIVNIIEGLGNDGAERTLSKVVLGRAKHSNSGVALTGVGQNSSLPIPTEISVQALQLRASLGNICRGILAFEKILRALCPDACQANMRSVDRLRGVATRMAGINSVVWDLKSLPPGLL